MQQTIFLSYRRDDSAATAGRIYDRLVTHFGREAVFKDVDSIPLGVDFASYIQSTMRHSVALLAVIGPHWVDIATPDGQRRLDDPGDPVRLEIEAALMQGIPLIPLLVQNATMPTVAQLPPSLQPLATRNGLAVRYDPDFDGDMRRVFATLEQWIAPLPRRSPVHAPARTDGGAQGSAQAAASSATRKNPLDTPDVRRRLWRRARAVAFILTMVDLSVFTAEAVAGVNKNAGSEDLINWAFSVTLFVVSPAILGIAGYRTTRLMGIADIGVLVASLAGLMAGPAVVILAPLIIATISGQLSTRYYWGDSSLVELLLLGPLAGAIVGFLVGGVCGTLGNALAKLANKKSIG